MDELARSLSHTDELQNREPAAPACPPTEPVREYTDKKTAAPKHRSFVFQKPA